MKNYYQILEIEPSATQDQIKSQYHFLAHAWHPDKFPNTDQKTKAEERLREINEAFSIIGDPVNREAYDNSLHPRSSPSVQPAYTWTTQKAQPGNPNPVDSKNICQSCGLACDTKYAEFYENVGLLILRYHKSAKGNFCKSCIDYYFWNFTGATMILGWWGFISLILTPFILLNNLLRFVFSRGLNRYPIQIAPSPSPIWVLSTIGGFLFIGFTFFWFVISVYAQPTNNSSVAVYPTKSPIIQATQPSTNPMKGPTQPPTLRPTNLPEQSITYNGITCVPWDSIDTSDLESQTCIYGKIYTYGPYSNKWNFIQFSPNSSAFRVVNFNGYYMNSLNIGDCVVVYGRIRDNGGYLMITPDKDVADSVSTGPSNYCDFQ